MSQRSGPPPIVYILLALLLLGGGYWWFSGRKQPQANQAPGLVEGTNSANSLPVTAPNSTFPSPNSVPSGTTVRIDGSTSMVTINENLKKAFQTQFPGTSIVTNAQGTNVGIQALLAGQVDIAAISRPLTAQETNQGLVLVPVATDAIAVIVSSSNPFNGSLTSAQVADIFRGKINNWSAVGGPGVNIRVINRPPVSGTYQSFKEQVLKGADFGTTPNISALQRDETTGLIRALGADGIGYATFAQVKNQSTAKVIPIDGLRPDSAAYPYTRQLFYVYKSPASSAVQAFLGYTTSPKGQQAVVLLN